MKKLVDTFIRTANAFDVDDALALFQSDAVIEDVSVGEAFTGADLASRGIADNVWRAGDPAILSAIQR